MPEFMKVEERYEAYLEYLRTTNDSPVEVGKESNLFEKEICAAAVTEVDPDGWDIICSLFNQRIDSWKEQNE